MQLIGILFFYFKITFILVFLRRLWIIEGKVQSILQFKDYVYAFIYFSYLQIGVHTLSFAKYGFNAKGQLFVFEIGDEIGLQLNGSKGVNDFFSLMILNYDVQIR